MSHSIEPYNVYREAAAGCLPRRSRQTGGKPLGDVLTSAQLAVGRRLAGVDGQRRRPLATGTALRDAASAAAASPEGPGVPLSLATLNEVLSQPAMIGHDLGPVAAAAVQAVAVSIRAGRMAPITALYAVMRTMGVRSVRRQRAGSAPTGGPDMLAFVGAGHEREGIGYVLGTCLDRDARTTSQEFGEDYETEEELARLQVRTRMVHLAAIRRELQRHIPQELLVLLRAERRFVEGEEGAVTADELWSVIREPFWKSELDEALPSGVPLLEVPTEWIRHLEYHFEGGTRTLNTLDSFLSDVERRDPTAGAWTLLMSNRAREREIAGADDVVVLDGCFKMPDDEFVTPVIVLGEAGSTVHVIPRGRAERLGDAGWDTVRIGLSAVYGSAAARSSHDQGQAMTEPFEHALSLTDADLDRAVNLECIRAYAHAVEESRHWLGDTPPTPQLTPEQERKSA
jgi:hypothetical protein